MSYKQAKIDLQKHFNTAWTAAYSTITIAWLNDKFSKPSNLPWVRFTARTAGATRVELGANDQKLYAGIVDVEIFCPTDQKGLNDIYTYIDAIVAIFENQIVSGNHFDEHGLYGPVVTEEGWLKANVSFSFIRYE